MILQDRADEDLDTLILGVGFQYYHLIARKLDLEPSIRNGE